MQPVFQVLFCLLIFVTSCTAEMEPTPPAGSTRTAENTDELCSDGIDNDGDTYLDCTDTDCINNSAVSVCSADAENSTSFCSDGQDNDGDGLVDCADPECESFGCNEASDEFCADGLDNDGDNWVDCEDFSCKYGCEVTVCNSDFNPENSQEECSDGIDNDGDGKVDCEDRGCQDCNEECQVGLGENSLSLCSDGLDNDGDGAIDCQDTECPWVEGIEGCDTGEENTDELCADGVDNDNDPYVDCEDKNCEGFASCVENTPEACSDGVDNDGDSYIDCQDFDCSGLGACGESTDAECQDGIDNDGNGYTDCEDFGCKYGCAVTVCPGAEKSEAQCTDGIDNDGDTYLDCADQGCQECVPQCSGETGEDSLELCSDGQDNDNDGAVDCQDPECTAFFDELESCDTGETECDDGQDNDNDPFVDCADRDCSSDPACAENTDEKCSDGIDNDGDQYIDCNDFDCSQNPAVTLCGETSAEDTDATCADGQDNDNDGYTDCDDSGCSGNPALSVCPTPANVSIRQLQDDTAQDAVILGDNEYRRRVRLSNVVVTSSVLSARDGRFHFFVQEAFPPADVSFSGIQVYSSSEPTDINLGDTINLTGFYKEFYGLSEVEYGTHEVVSEGSALNAKILSTADLSTESELEAYEGVLIELQDLQVVEIGVQSRGGSTAEFNDFSVKEASATEPFNTLVIGTDFYPMTPAVEDVFSSVTGPLTYSWSQFRLSPRSESDIQAE